MQPTTTTTTIGPGQAAINKFLRRVVPLCMLAYLVAYLDRGNIGIAKLQMGEALGIDAAAFGLGAGLFFIGYCIFEIPSNYAMKAVGARIWVTRIMITWGLVTVATAFVQGETSFYIARLALGAAEAGFAPAMLFYFTMWLPRRDRAKAFGFFGLAIPIATVVGGPLGGWLLTLGGPLQGWQWLFIIEGLLAVAMAAVVFTWLPSTPNDAKWLNDAERTDLARLVDADQSISAVSEGGLAGYAVYFKQPQLWALLGVLFLAYSGIYAVATFLPSMLSKNFGLGTVAVGWLVAIPSLVAIPVTLWVARSCARRGYLAAHIAVVMGVGGLALTLTGVISLPLPAFIIAMSLVVSATVAYAAPLFSLATTIIGSKAGPVAMFTTIGALGGFFGPTLMGAIVQANGGTYATSAIVLGLLLVLSAVLAILAGLGGKIAPAAVAPDAVAAGDRS